MYISEVINYNSSDCEAELCVSDGQYSVICYAYPVQEITLHQSVSSMYGFMCTDIVKSFEHIYRVNKLSQYYAYSLTARVIARNSCIVQVGDLRIYLDTAIPKDIVDGDYVSFCVQRLDLNQS